jgi:diguanylate cyclase (GGDEF)-like protein
MSVTAGQRTQPMSSIFPHGFPPRIATEQNPTQTDSLPTYVEKLSSERHTIAEDGLTDLPRRVLLVEPTASEAFRFRSELTASKFEVYTAQDLITATHALSLFQPDIILSQLRLTTYGGLELLRRLKEDPKTRSIPVILYCDLASARERIQALEMGAVDVLTKPFISDELIARVRAVLRAKQSVSLLERRAHRDSLTGLANRGVLEEQLTQLWDSCRRHEIPLSIVIVDLDRFKVINDTYGHRAGDDVLRETARILVHSVRSSDLVARYGGEEFVVIAPSCSITTSLELAERFRARLADHKITVDSKTITVTASVGLAAADWTKDGPAEVLRQADEALYQAKRSGRNSIWVFDSVQRRPTLAVAPGADNRKG